MNCMYYDYFCVNSTVNSTGSVCNYGDVRLVNGDNQYEGRVEVCINNGWQTICDNSWSSNDAIVICKQLGYAYSGCKLYNNDSELHLIIVNYYNY